MKTFSLIILILVVNSISLAQEVNSFSKEVFEVGSKTHFDNYEKCGFYFECDCCHSELMFLDGKNYIYLSYCMSDVTVTSGTYNLHGNQLRLTSSTQKIERKYNWEAEVDDNAVPYFVKDTTINQYELVFELQECDGIMLVNQTERGTWIAIKSESEYSELWAKLEDWKITSLLKD